MTKYLRHLTSSHVNFRSQRSTVESYVCIADASFHCLFFRISQIVLNKGICQSKARTYVQVFGLAVNCFRFGEEDEDEIQF